MDCIEREECMLLGISGVEGAGIGALIGVVEILVVIGCIGFAEFKKRRIKRMDSESKPGFAIFSRV